MADRDDKPVGDKPAITETQWQAAAIASALLSVALGIAGSFWILGLVPPEAITPDDMAARGRALTPIGTFLIAIVTFCTVAWRAKVTERQANAQERQLASADDNNLAILLQKGAELVADENENKIAAGVACLEAVAIAENGRYATQALNLLAKYIEASHQIDHTHHLFDAAVRVLNRSYQLGRETTVTIKFDGLGRVVDWKQINFSPNIEYSNGTLETGFTEIAELNTRAKYLNCKFKFFDIKSSFKNCYDCEFYNCRIFKLSGGVRRSHFVLCDFSDASVEIRIRENTLDTTSIDSMCYYKDGHPPHFSKNTTSDHFMKSLRVKE